MSRYFIESDDCNLLKFNYKGFNVKNPNQKKKEYYADETLPIQNDKLSYIHITYGSRPFYVKTPIMTVPFKISEKDGSFQFSLQFTNYKDNEEMNRFYNLIRNIELQQMKFIGLDETNTELYLSQIRRDKKKQYDPNLLIKIPFRYTKMEADAYTKEGQPMTILSIHRFSKAECVIYIDRIWKFNDMFVCKWKLKTIYLR